MDPQRHAKLSASRRGGAPEDYYPLHAFFDTTKELCSDNRHRVLHNLWGIRRVVIPIFGAQIATAGGVVATKDVCEADHVLADFSGKYLPTLATDKQVDEIVKRMEITFAQVFEVDGDSDDDSDDSDDDDDDDDDDEPSYEDDLHYGPG